MTPVLLADGVGPGATAFFIVMALIAVAIVIFFALVGSLRRLRKNAAQGNFGWRQDASDASGKPPLVDRPIGDPVSSQVTPTRDQGQGDEDA